MHAQEPRPAGRLSTAAEFADACDWVAAAHACGDTEQIAVALTNIYRVLMSNGWHPSERASILLRMHDGALEAELTLVRGAGPAST